MKRKLSDMISTLLESDAMILNRVMAKGGFIKGTFAIRNEDHAGARDLYRYGRIGETWYVWHVEVPDYENMMVCYAGGSEQMAIFKYNAVVKDAVQGLLIKEGVSNIDELRDGYIRYFPSAMSEYTLL